MRRDQKVNVVRHDHVSVQVIGSKILRSVKEGVNCETRDRWTAQVKWSGLLTLKKLVHHRKRLTGGEVFREDTVFGKSSMESPRPENRAILRL